MSLLSTSVHAITFRCQVFFVENQTCVTKSVHLILSLSQGSVAENIHRRTSTYHTFCLLRSLLPNTFISSDAISFCLSRSSFLLPPVDKHVFKGINCATNTLWYQALIVSCFISRQFSIRAYIRDLVWYCFVFLLIHPPVLGDFAWCHRVVERFIRHIIGCCLFFFCFLKKLLCVLKSEFFLFLSAGEDGEFNIIFLSVDSLVVFYFLCLFLYTWV